jgi:hypothetical protein
VVNRRSRAANFRLIDRIPYTAKKSDVQVTPALATPRPTHSEKGGRMQWEFSLDPGGQQKLTYGYGLRYRTNLVVQGQEGGSAW